LSLISVPIAERGTRGSLAVALILFALATLAGWGLFSEGNRFRDASDSTDSIRQELRRSSSFKP
jgi:hypothetical protein